MVTLMKSEVRYGDLVDGDTLVDKSENRWIVSGVEHTVTETAFWLGDARTARLHRLVKPIDDAVTVERPESHVEEFERLHNEFPDPDGIEADLDTVDLTPTAEEGVTIDADGGIHVEGGSQEEPKMTLDEIKDYLGADVVAEETAEQADARTTATLTGKPFSVPTFAEMTMLEQQSHLYLVHGVFAADVKTVKALTALHDEAHAAYDAGTPPGKHVAHVHEKQKAEASS